MDVCTMCSRRSLACSCKPSNAQSVCSAVASSHQLSLQASALHTLVVNVYRLTTSSAEIIASLQRPPSIQVVLRNGSGPQRRVLQILSSGSAMTDLTLRECTSSMLEGLCTMPHLSSLSIAMSNINDANLHLQPCVTHLTLPPDTA